MLTGKSFRLTADMLGVQKSEGKYVAITVPAQAVIRVTSGPTDTRLVEAEWNGNQLLIFVEDVEKRCQELRDEG